MPGEAGCRGTGQATDGACHNPVGGQVVIEERGCRACSTRVMMIRPRSDVVVLQVTQEGWEVLVAPRACRDRAREEARRLGASCLDILNWGVGRWWGLVVGAPNKGRGGRGRVRARRRGRRGGRGRGFCRPGGRQRRVGGRATDPGVEGVAQGQCAYQRGVKAGGVKLSRGGVPGAGGGMVPRDSYWEPGDGERGLFASPRSRRDCRGCSAACTVD